MGNKFGARKVAYNGFKFDSKAEKERYVELMLMQKKGLIRELELQPEFEIVPALYRDIQVHLKTKIKNVRQLVERAARYHADFMYYDCSLDVYVIEEVKGEYLSKQKDYILRRKLIRRKIAEMNEDVGCEKYIFNEIRK